MACWPHVLRRSAHHRACEAVPGRSARCHGNAIACHALSVQASAVHSRVRCLRSPPAGNAGLPNPAFNTDVLQRASPAVARGLTPRRYAAALPRTFQSSGCGMCRVGSRARCSQGAAVKRCSVARVRGAASCACGEPIHRRGNRCLPRSSRPAFSSNGALRYRAVAVRFVRAGSRLEQGRTISPAVPSGLARHNPSLHLTGYSGLRPLPPAGELQR